MEAREGAATSSGTRPELVVLQGFSGMYGEIVAGAVRYTSCMLLQLVVLLAHSAVKQIAGPVVSSVLEPELIEIPLPAIAYCQGEGGYSVQARAGQFRRVAKHSPSQRSHSLFSVGCGAT